MKYTKIDYKKSKYLELPDSIVKLICKDDYRASFKSSMSYVIELKIQNQTDFNSLEIEFDIEKNRFLTREERQIKVPKDRELLFAKYNVEIFMQYFLEEETDVLKESYQIYSLTTNEKLESYTQNYFSMKRTFEDKAKEVYEREKEKEAYREWSDFQKASYWAGKFHRWMRWAGEDGLDEIDFFESKIFEQFRKEEPNIDDLMPLILTELAKVWMFDVDEFFEKVNKRLGTLYTRLK